MYANENGVGLYADNQLGAIAVAPVVSGAISLVKGLFGGSKSDTQRYADLVREMARPLSDPARAQWVGSMRAWASRGDAVSARVLSELQAGQHGGIGPAATAQPVSTATQQRTVAQEIVSQVVPELLDTRAGQQLVKTVIEERADAATRAATPWLLPLAIGAGLLLLKK